MVDIADPIQYNSPSMAPRVNYLVTHLKAALTDQKENNLVQSSSMNNLSGPSDGLQGWEFPRSQTAAIKKQLNG